MRLFIAIEIPEDLKKWLARLRVDIPGCRWTALEQIHLTLAFLGEVDEARLEGLTAALARIRTPEFSLRLVGTGCFPGRQHPRVLWVGVEREPRLEALAARVRTALLAQGIPQEERHFSAHITLARLKLAKPSECAAFLDQHRNLKLPPFSVRDFRLFQSRLTPHSAEHIPLKTFPLKTRSREE